MSNLQYVDLEYGVRVGYETKGEGLDGEHEFRIHQFPLHEAVYHDGASVPEWQETVWPYGGRPASDPEGMKQNILTTLFEMHLSGRVRAHSYVWLVEVEDKYTIRGWQA